MGGGHPSDYLKYVHLLVKRSSIMQWSVSSALQCVCLSETFEAGGGSAQEESWADCQESCEPALNGGLIDTVKGRKQGLLKAAGPTMFGWSCSTCLLREVFSDRPSQSTDQYVLH